MTKKPFVIIVIAGCFLISPFIIILQTSLSTNTPVIGPYNVTDKFSPHDWIVLALYPVCAAAVFFVRRWGWYVYILATLYLVGSNAAVLLLRPHYGAAIMVLYNIILAAVAGVFFRRAVIAPYFNPGMRWWRQAPRLRFNIFTELGPDGKRAEVIDLSASGVFVSCREQLRVGTMCLVTLHCLSHTVILESAVTRGAGRGREEGGYGLRFVRVGAIEKTGLRQMLRDLARAGAVNRERRSGRRPAKPIGSGPRFRLSPFVSLRTDGVTRPATLVDLSRGGCLVQPLPARRLPLNEPCRLNFTLFTMELTLDGFPRWTGSLHGETVTGIVFDFKNRLEKKRLRSLIAACRRGHAPRRAASSRPPATDDLTASEFHSPYRFVDYLRRKLRLKR